MTKIYKQLFRRADQWALLASGTLGGGLYVLTLTAMTDLIEDIYWSPVILITSMAVYFAVVSATAPAFRYIMLRLDRSRPSSDAIADTPESP